jgi:hypothetical protein
MNEPEVIDLLTYVAFGDNRTFGAAEVSMWARVLPQWLDLPLAMEAVDMHRRDSTEYLVIGHITANAKRINMDRRREEARLHALDPARKEQPSVAPWWFKKLRDAEIAHTASVRKANPKYRKRITNPTASGADPVSPMYEGDELTIEQKLTKFGIVREPGDEYASAVAAVALVTPATPVPKLGSFIRDPENPRGADDDPFNFG